MTEKKNIPQHVAIIMDGNRRWAREHGKKSWEGHYAGAENAKQLIKTARDQNVRCLSLWGSSLNNITKRPPIEVKALVDVYKKYFSELQGNREVHDNKVRINIIGRWREHFPAALVKMLEECEEETKAYDEYRLNFFLAYNGDDEMLYAITQMMDDGLTAGDVNEETLKAHLMTKDLPEIDLLIRTGDDPHISTGFCMWDTRSAQLYFAQEMFPDFGEEAFIAALEDFAKSTRRDGK